MNNINENKENEATRGQVKSFITWLGSKDQRLQTEVQKWLGKKDEDAKVFDKNAVWTHGVFPDPSMGNEIKKLWKEFNKKDNKKDGFSGDQGEFSNPKGDTNKPKKLTKHPEIRRVFFSPDGEIIDPDIIDEENRVNQEILNSIEPICMTMKETKPGDEGGRPMELTSVKCSNPTVSIAAGSLSGMGMRIAYHYSPLSTTSKLKNSLKKLGMQSDSLNTPDGRKFMKEVFKKLKSNPKKTAIALAIIGSGFFAYKAMNPSDTAGLGRDVASGAQKPFKEGKKFFELIPDLINIMDSANPLVKDETTLSWVIDPCFAGAFLVGLSSLSILRLATGRTTRAYRVQKWLESVDLKDLEIDELIEATGNNGLRKALDGRNSAIGAYQDAMSAKIDDFLGSDEIIAALEDAPLNADQLREYLSSLRLGGPKPPNLAPKQAKFLNEINKKLTDNIADDAAMKGLIKDAVDANETLVDTWNTFLKQETREVGQALLANKRYFKVLDLVPGQRITADDVEYLVEMRIKAGKAFKKSLDKLDEIRNRLANENKWTVDQLQGLKDLEKTLDNDVTYSLVSKTRKFPEVPRLSKSATEAEKEAVELAIIKRDDRVSDWFEIALQGDKKQLDFINSLTPQQRLDVFEVYKQKSNILQAADNLDANSRILKNKNISKKDLKASRRKLGDKNDYVDFANMKNADGKFEKDIALRRSDLGVGGMRYFGARPGVAEISSLFLLSTGVKTLYTSLTNEVKVLPRETIEIIHNTLDNPYDVTMSDEDFELLKQREVIIEFQKVISSIYINFRDNVARNPNLTYEDLFKYSLEDAVQESLNIRTKNYKEETKVIVTILAFEYLKRPSKNDLLSPDYEGELELKNRITQEPWKPLKPSDQVELQRIKDMIVYFKNKEIITKVEYSGLFDRSYAVVKGTLEEAGRGEEFKSPKDATSDPTPDTTGQEGEKPTPASEQPEKQQDEAPGSRGDLKINRSAVEAAGRKFIPNIEQIGKEQGVNPALFAALIFTESSFKPKRKSTAGAVGLSQLMPKTAEQYGVEDRTDPVQNITGGMKFLKNGVKSQLQQAMSQHPKLDWNKLSEEDKLRLILYAYNWGAPNLISTSNGFDLRGKNPKYANRTNKQLMKAIDDWYKKDPKGQTGGKNYATKILTKAKEYGYNPGMPAFFNPSGTIKEYKLNDLRKLVTEVMSGQKTPEQRSIRNTDIDKRRVKEMNKKNIKELVAEVLNENSGQGYSKYPYNVDVGSDEAPAEDYIEEWKALSLDLVRDESRDTAIKIAKILVKDLELFEDVLDLAGQNQSLGSEILRKLKETKDIT